MKGFRFNGKHSSEYGIVVESTKRSLMSPLEAKTIKIPNRAGEYLFGIEKGMRTFTVTCSLIIENTDWIWEIVHDINKWLIRDEEEEIIFDHEPDITYFGFLSGDSPIDKKYTHGTFDLTFICPDPYGYGPEFETALVRTSPTNVTISGYQPTYPVVVAEFSHPSTYFTLATKKKHIHLGAPAGVTETTIPKYQTRFNDEMTTITDWVQHSGVEGGIVTGEFSSTGQSFKVADYGEGGGWHGPCLKRMANVEMQHFRMESRVQFSSGDQKEIGKLELYLLDNNGAIIGKIGVSDSSGNERTTIEARAGNSFSGRVITKFVGDMKYKKRKVVTKKKIKGKMKDVTSYVTDGWSEYSDFYGMLRVERVGKKWTIYTAKINKTTGRHYSKRTRVWVDSKNLYNEKVAGVALHVAQHGTKPTVDYARVYQVKLTQINITTEFDVPEIIDAGDEITIDCETGAVLKNGEPFTEELHISSEFFPLNPGINNIAFEPDHKCNVTVYHRGKYL